MKKISLILLSVSLAACSSSQIKKSDINKAYEVEIVEAEGSAPIVNAEIQKAKEVALADSMKNALAIVVGVYVSADTLVSKSILIDDDITSRSEGYIEKYKVLKEYKDGDFYKTKIEAHVRKEDLAAKLKKLETDVEKIGNPVVYMKIAEKIGERDLIGDYAGGEFIAKMRNDGFRVASKPEDADILASGNVKAGYSSNEGLGGFLSYSAALSLEIKAKSGEVVGAVNATAGGIGVNDDVAGKEAIINTARKSYPDLKKSIITYYQQKRIIVFKASNVKNMNQINDLIKYFRNIPVIRDCVLKSYSQNYATLEILMRKGNSADILPVLSKNQNFIIKQSFPFEVTVEMAEAK